MKDTLNSLTTALKMIVTDPVNLFLALVPAVLGIIFYAAIIAVILNNLEEMKIFLQGFNYTSNYAGLISKVLAALFVVLIIFIMSWSFVLLVGIIAAPFNSLLSERIEDKVLGSRQPLKEEQDIFEQFKKSFRFSLSNEMKKVILLTVLGLFALLLGLVPLLSPLSLFLIALLLSAQFLDYSWSRHNLPLRTCLKDMKANIVSYFFGGMIFLALAAVPLLNALLPAFGTSYFTVLWLKRQKKIAP